MNLTPKMVTLGLAWLGVVVSSLPAAPLRVLYFTKSAGFEHSVVKRVEGKPSYSENVLAGLAEKDELVFTFSKDGGKFSPEYLAQFDVILFYTSGDLCSVGTDGQPAISPEGKQALLDAIKGGKGFVGLHSCSDTFHTGEHGGGNNPIREPRFKNYGDQADLFIQMLGGEFIRHGPQQVAAARVVDASFPGFGGLGAEVKVREEWYTLKEFAADNHALLVMETAGMEGSDYARPNYPLAWARPYGKGRVAYHAMGHREDVWDSAAYQAMVVGMIRWAGRAVEADVTPNLAAAAPEAGTIQKWVEPPAKK